MLRLRKSSSLAVVVEAQAATRSYLQPGDSIAVRVPLDPERPVTRAWADLVQELLANSTLQRLPGDELGMSSDGEPTWSYRHRFVLATTDLAALPGQGGLAGVLRIPEGVPPGAPHPDGGTEYVRYFARVTVETADGQRQQGLEPLTVASPRSQYRAVEGRPAVLSDRGGYRVVGTRGGSLSGPWEQALGPTDARVTVHVVPEVTAARPAEGAFTGRLVLTPHQPARVREVGVRLVRSYSAVQSIATLGWKHRDFEQRLDGPIELQPGDDREWSYELRVPSTMPKPAPWKQSDEPLRPTYILSGQWQRWFLLGAVQFDDGQWATGGVEVNIFTGDDD
jgi:hypothetical protein